MASAASGMAAAEMKVSGPHRIELDNQGIFFANVVLLQRSSPLIAD
jgi:hypothetical protein